MQVSGHRIRVGLPAFALHQEVLGLTENLRFVEQALVEVFAQPLKVEYATLPAPAPRPAPTRTVSSSGVVEVAGPGASAEGAAPVPPIVQDIVKLFDATIINRPPSP